MRRVLAILILSAVTIALSSVAANAEIHTDEESIGVSLAKPGGSGGSGGGSGATYHDCVDTDLILTGFTEGMGDFFGKSPDITTNASLAYRTCVRDGDGASVGWVTGLPGVPAGVPDVQTLLAQAQANLNLSLPNLATSPPRGGVMLVGLPVWFWIPNFTPATATAAIPGLSATITARPARTTISLGDGQTLRCTGRGTPYNPGVGHRSQQSACTHAYDRYGDMHLVVTTAWSLTWAASDGQAGALPDATRTSRPTIALQEAQAVTS